MVDVKQTYLPDDLILHYVGAALPCYCSEKKRAYNLPIFPDKAFLKGENLRKHSLKTAFKGTKEKGPNGKVSFVKVPSRHAYNFPVLP